MFDNDLLIIGASVLVLIAGYVFGRVAEKLTKKLYMNLISRKAKEAGIDEIEKEMKIEKGIGHFIAKTVKFAIYGIAIIIVMDLVGLTPLSNLLIEVLKYIPNLIGALLIVMLGIIASEIAQNITIVVLSDDKLSGILKDLQINAGEIAGLMVKYYIYLLAITMAAKQVGIASMPLEIIVGVISLGFVGAGLIFLNYSVKDMLPNLLASEYIRNRKVIQEGDYIEIGDIRGKVIKIGGVHTLLKYKKEEIRVPNSKIYKEGLKIRRTNQ